jgi:hypothetical protein|tara:strand:- start:60 stop:266 length:207 start_codon:yes stop_codon:yes gene_type:complete
MERSEVVVYNYKYLLARNEIAQRWTSTLCRSEVANDIQPYAFFVSLSNMIVLLSKQEINTDFAVPANK